MGTNYYWISDDKPCWCCGRGGPERVHIGKSSAGWDFGFHAPNGIRSWTDWRERIRSGGHVEDEYGNQMSPDEFISYIEGRNRGQNHLDYCLISHPEHARSLWKDEQGYCFDPGEFA